ncbi:MAG TPA: cyanophycin synthetase, partial [Candidatus Dormibacteraeota bacterium]|nr:cyanophycin synthetase [Candidatus Dormibacteraeota bacterium]
YAVIETGLGGLHDATNVVTRPDKVCVITDIGLDHTYILGKTIKQIAAQKIGIVHENNQVFTYAQNQEVMSVFKDWTDRHKAILHSTTQDAEAHATGLDLSGVPNYQVRNWLLAHRVYEYLVKRDNLPSLTSKVLLQTLNIKIPGRMDVRHVKGKTIIMDGAHNLQKMSALIESFKQLYPGVKPAVVIGLKNDKDYQDVVAALSGLAARVITTGFFTSQDLPVKSMNPELLAKAFDGRVPTEVIADPVAATRALYDAPEPIGLITGSFYLLSEIRNNKGLL